MKGSFRSLAAAALAAAFFALSAHGATSQDVFRQVKDKLLVVQCDDSSGAGFVCEMDGKRYFVTGKHVISGQRRVAAYLQDGTALKFGRLEVAENADIVRFAVASNHPALMLSQKALELRQKVCVSGTDERSGGVSHYNGTVSSVGPEKVGVTARFPRGSNGSAALDESGDVLGVAAFDALDNNPKAWIRKNAQPVDAGRMVLRIGGVKWRKSDLNSFFREAEAQKAKMQKEAGIFPQVQASFKAPSLKINKHQVGKQAARYFVNGNIVLGLSGLKGVKNPVVRVVMLLGCGADNVVMDAVSCEPGGKYKFSYMPICSYGMPMTSSSYDAGNGLSVYCIEGLSYFQRECAFGSAKNIEYFDKSSMQTGGFHVHSANVRGNVVPKLVAYRFECWQNGSLAAVYDSMRPDTLNSRKIPVDWFVMGRYPTLFTYARH